MKHALSWVELSKDNLEHNITQFKNLTADVRFLTPSSVRDKESSQPQHQSAVKLFSVIKGNAYGHGQNQIVTLLNQTAVDGYMVFDIYEALAVAEQTTKSVSVLSYIGRDHVAIRQASKMGIILPIVDLDSAIYLNSLGDPLLVQIKLDTGTNRLGFRVEEAERAIQTISKLPNLQIRGVFTHFADSENPDTTFTDQQLETFRSLIQKLESRGVQLTLNHCACTAASLHNKHFLFNGVRLGIGTYGLWPAAEAQTFTPLISLRPVLAWRSRVMHIKKIIAGETVGYGNSYRVEQDANLAVLPVGYFDGYDRGLSNTGEVLIKGDRFPIRGRVCMNLLMVELPKNHTIAVGDIATLIGRDQHEEITADELAKKTQTINYEIVTRINPQIPRLII